MAEIINMPKLGFDMKEGQLVRWLKNEGESVNKGDVLAEIESDKATVEVESFTSGTLLKCLSQPGDWIPIGAPIAVIGQAGEQIDLAALGLKTPEAAAVPAAAATTTPAAPAKKAAAGTVVAPNGGNGHSAPDDLRASPLAKRLAKEYGINLSALNGSGPQGRIVKADVEAFHEGGVSAPAAPGSRPAPTFTPLVTGPEDETIPAPRLRQRIAARMVESKTSVPHFYVTTEIDMEAALNLRKEINARRTDEDKISVNDMIVKGAALTLRQYPNLNASFNGESILRHNRVHIGIAVSVEGGLLNVVSQNADVTPLTAMARTHREMIARARSGKVRPEDVEGETFAVSNLGAYDVEHFIAIINPPDAAIMAVGSAVQVPVVKDGELAIGWRMKATLSADHRVTDGAEAAQFMQAFRQIMQDPLRLLM
jgi:pyruvate dehydrogenase E2 component (dihydrolipoamide acetyltransferase)